MMRLILFLLFIHTINSTLYGQHNILNKKDEKKIQAFIKKISGVYNNQSQADTAKSPLLKLSEIRVFQIWTHKKREYWLSIGWYQPDFPEQPMGEKIFHIKSVRNDTFLVDCYSWAAPEGKSYLLQWNVKHPYKKHNIDDLVSDGCENYMVKKNSGEYELKTLEDQICIFNNPMAPFDGLFFHFVFDPTGQKMDIYDKNYKDGELLFHYVDAPMLMNKINTSLKEKESASASRLKVGSKPELFKIQDVRGNNISLKRILREDKLLLVFLRHAWCPVCNYRTHELINNYDQLKKTGYHVIVIYESNKENLLPYVNDHDLPYSVVADPEHKLYKAFKVEFSPEKMIKSRTNTKMLAHYKKGVELFGKKEYTKGEGEVKSSIIPADFIIDKEGKIEVVYYGEYIGDHLPVKNLLEAVNTHHRF